jgi:outer membrane protein assembly factor BamB
MRQSRLRCLDAATGRLVWEAPFTGSPSWSRQAPPVVHENLAIYSFGSGKYAPQGSAKPFVFQGTPQASADGAEVMSWIYTHDNPYYPQDNRPLVRAWDLDSGKVAWSRDFSEHGRGGNDSGLCLMDGTLYYSTFFGYAAQRRGQPGPHGLTAAMDPATGEVRWLTTKYSVTAGCTISGSQGRLYLGGYNRPDGGTTDRYVRCLDARDGSLVWQSDPVASAVNVVTVGEKLIFSNASGQDGHVIDKQTGKIVSRFNYGYACTRFTVSEPYVLGANMDVIELADGNRLVSTGPPVEARECVGSTISNGRLFYTAQASGLQLSMVYGDEAAARLPPWKAGRKEREK